jgi:hypothetical protein
MNILWLTVDRSHRVAHHFDDFREVASKFANVTMLKKSLTGDKGQNMWHLSRRLINGEVKQSNIVINHLEHSSTYDFIFCDAFFAYLNEPWKSFNIPSAIFIEDVHGSVPQYQIDKAKVLGIQTIFHRFNYGFHRYHPKAKFDFKCIWLPHSIKLDRFSDTVKKSIDVLHTGVCPEAFYPDRHKAVKLLTGKSYFKRVLRPRDKPGTLRQNKWPIDRDYDNLLQSAWICVTGGSIIDAPVQKYVEIPAAKSLLLSNWFTDLGMLGFKDGYNMVSYHPENLIKVVEELLKDRNKISEISRKGYELILSKHTSEIRSKQFINFICQLLNKSQEFPSIESCSYQVNFNGNSSMIKIGKVEKIKEVSKVGLTHTNMSRSTDWRSRIRQAELVI